MELILNKKTINKIKKYAEMGSVEAMHVLATMDQTMMLDEIKASIVDLRKELRYLADALNHQRMSAENIASVELEQKYGSSRSNSDT